MPPGPPIPPISPDSLRTLLEDAGRKRPFLVDVREPEEYAQSHLPGARLIPLMELPERIAEIPPDTIFYCRSGQRSGMAVEEAVRQGRSGVRSLSGGMLAWEGVAVPDFPKLGLFELSGGLPDILRRAMDLEKGAERFYLALCGLLAGTPAARTVRDLAEAETAHARALHGLLTEVQDGEPRGFERAYAALPGELLEGGESLESALSDAKVFGQGDPGFLLELALEMELRALDLYTGLAGRAEDRRINELMTGLAEQERAHAGRVARAIGACQAS